MQGIKRKVVYVTLYEGIAIVVAGVGLAWVTGRGAGQAGAAAVMASAVAVAWNLAFNWLFEAWESCQAVAGRSVARRVAHAVGFEGGIAALLVPLFAWWLAVSLWQSFMINVGLLAFFLGYTFVFNWVFDRVFGLPTSAMGLQAALK